VLSSSKSDNSDLIVEVEFFNTISALSILSVALDDFIIPTPIDATLINNFDVTFGFYSRVGTGAFKLF
jgi:hypothetical protein